ncbi:hypothetical protein ANO11243_031980 [Dothideomycetidae sp. 11243]|nr:hypothetical protein ANO11243_031980 [fungal sp. No.11243]
MDFSSLKDQVSNLTLYDLKAGVRKVQNAVMNYTEMESKYGSPLSRVCAQYSTDTSRSQLLNEIMPMIYKRFTEKSAEEWRQIYKALQLMEFLVKHGSERVIDDARSHLSLLKMLRQFHYIDPNGKDQGINVRNRSKELTDLLSDVERIRSERKKAKTTRGKYGGVEGGMGLGGSMSGSSRYGGFGSESGGGYGGFSGGVYGDGGGFGGQQAAEDYDAGSSEGRRGERFEEYDEYDEGTVATTSKRRTESSRSAPNRNKKQPDPPKAKEPEVDLFDFGDEPSAAPSNGHAATSGGDFGGFQAGANGDDDDFDDFQSAGPSTTTSTTSKPAASTMVSSLASIAPPSSTSTFSANTQFAAPQPKANKPSDFSGIFATSSPPPQAQIAPVPAPSSISSMASPPAQARPTGYQPSGPNYFTSVSLSQSGGASAPVSMPGSIGSSSGSAAMKKPAARGDAFASLLSGSKFGASNKTAQGQTMSMQEMAKQKASAGLWGAPATAAATGPALGAPRQQQQQQQPRQGGGGGALDDLLG